MPLTQNYDRFLVLGPLTNRRIAHYQKQGFYGVDAQKALHHRDGKRDKAHKERQKHLKPTKADLLKLY